MSPFLTQMRILCRGSSPAAQTASCVWAQVRNGGTPAHSRASHGGAASGVTAPSPSTHCDEPHGPHTPGVGTPSPAVPFPPSGRQPRGMSSLWLSQRSSRATLSPTRGWRGRSLRNMPMCLRDRFGDALGTGKLGKHVRRHLPGFPHLGTGDHALAARSNCHVADQIATTAHHAPALGEMTGCAWACNGDDAS